MADEALNQPPVEQPVAVEEQDGAESSLPAEQPTAEQPGAETEKAAPTERIYTQAEVSAMESAKDRENADLRRAYAQQAMQQELARMEAIEARQQAQDRQAVEDGDITSAEASSRQQQRQQAEHQKRVGQQQLVAANQITAEAEQYGRILAARDYGEKYGVNPTELLNDKGLTSPPLMEAKAAKIALEKTQGQLKAAKQGSETFDAGVMGNVGASIENMSPEEKISHALARPPRKQK